VKTKKLSLIAEILEEDTVLPEDLLSSFALWDSMAVLSVIAMLEEVYAIEDADGEEIAACETVNDLMQFMMEKDEV
jgi:acyl carrier protein